ncbi:flavodoxin domain-containing protein [Chlorobium sp. N1]|uniref:flavodoxin domain-containing protein n=1 Tax=Chlorobium sp. N1 TaxID=2491138 RepID=UPI0013F14DF7|nr:flavodoxin domain-containing protein [Chlorobium sp. N1]
MQNDTCSRREFLKRTARYSTLALSALLFGADLAAAFGRESGRSTAILYATRYGATKQTAGWIGEGMASKPDLVDIEQVSTETVLDRYDRVIVGSGIWIGGAHEKVLEFFGAENARLEEKLAATFIVCGSVNGTEAGMAHARRYLSAMHAPLRAEPPISRAFGGRLAIEELSDEDVNALREFYHSILHKEMSGWDRRNPDPAKRFGMELSRKPSPQRAEEAPL